MTDHTIDLTGRRALVTGGAGGFGGAVASLLLECGATVAINDRTRELADAAATRLGATLGVAADITDEQQVSEMVREAAEGLGGLDLLVNNAGIPGDFTRTVDQPVDEWQRVVDVHMRGTFLVSREVGRVLVGQRSGAVVNIGSITGLTGFPASNSYGVAKAAVSMMTKTMAAEWGRSGVRVNCVAPGIIDAGMFEQILAGTGTDRDLYLQRIPLRRLGTAADVARAVVLLLSDWSSYVTGVTLPVDGGWTAFGAPTPPTRRAKATA